MATFEKDAVDSALADAPHLNLHARAAVSNIDAAVPRALAEVADLLRGAGASEEEVKRATTAFQPVLQMLRSARAILETRKCSCDENMDVVLAEAEKIQARAEALQQRAAETMGEKPRGCVIIWAAKRFRHTPPHRDLIDLDAKYDSTPKGEG